MEPSEETPKELPADDKNVCSQCHKLMVEEEGILKCECQLGSEGEEEETEEEDRSMDAIPQKRRKNPVFFFPPVVLDAVNKEIDEGWKGPHIHHMVRAKYSTYLEKVPSRPTFDKYVRWYLGQKEIEGKNVISELEGNTADVAKGLEKIVDPGVPFLDKQMILEALVRKCAGRIKVLERWQKTTISPQFENSLLRYISEVRALVETLSKLQGEMPAEKNIVFTVVNDRIQPIFTAFYNVIKQVCPEKLDTARILLKEELRKVLPND